MAYPSKLHNVFFGWVNSFTEFVVMIFLTVIHKKIVMAKKASIMCSAAGNPKLLPSFCQFLQATCFAHAHAMRWFQTSGMICSLPKPERARDLLRTISLGLLMSMAPHRFLAVDIDLAHSVGLQSLI